MGMSLLPKLKLKSPIPAPTKVGTQATATKTPKAKKPADPFGKKSLFFKSEDFEEIKRPSIESLRSFLEKQRGKGKSSGKTNS
jgi:hypothetical protein